MKGSGERRGDWGGGIREAQGTDLSAVRPRLCRKVGEAVAELVQQDRSKCSRTGMGRGQNIWR